MKNTDKPIYLLLFVLAFAVNLAGINVNFFTDDPGLYASIAKTLIYKHDIIQLFNYNQDWLDKPHWHKRLGLPLACLNFLFNKRTVYLSVCA